MSALQTLAGSAFMAVAVAVMPAGAPVKTLTRLSSCDATTSSQRGLIANAEVEPSIATDRTGRNVVVVYQEDRSSRGGAGGIDVTSSEDGGSTWRAPTRLFGSSGADARNVSDPWVSIGPDGHVYAAALDTGLGAVATSSTDGGKTWARPQTLGMQTPTLLVDKPTITADPMRPNVAYAFWEQYPLRPGQPPIAADTAISITLDGGRSWSPPRPILRHAGNVGAMTTNVVGDPRTGVLYAFSLWIRGPEPPVEEPSKLLLQHSSDAGRTWSRPATIGTHRSAWLTLRDPATDKGIRPSVPSLAVDPRSGRLYAVWADNRFGAPSHVDHVVLSSSNPGGRRWSAPRRLDPASAALGLIPSVAVGADGSVAVTYFTVAPKASRVTYWAARSHDAGRTFTRSEVGQEFSLADAPFLTGIPAILVPGGLFLGDYMGLAATPKGFATAFVTANPTRDNASDVRFAIVR